MSGLKFPKSKPKKRKLTVYKVQIAFNAAIVRRDGSCVTSGGRDNLQCSHFFAVGGSSSLRFYPPNAHAQTAGEHINFHNRDVLPYVRFMEAYVPELEWMERARKSSIKYSQPILEQILEYCQHDELEELQEFIEGMIGGRDE